MRFDGVSLSFVSCSLGSVGLRLNTSDGCIGCIRICLCFYRCFFCCGLLVTLGTIGTLSAIAFVDTA